MSDKNYLMLERTCYTNYKTFKGEIEYQIKKSPVTEKGVCKKECIPHNWKNIIQQQEIKYRTKWMCWG